MNLDKNQAEVLDEVVKPSESELYAQRTVFNNSKSPSLGVDKHMADAN